jgi:OOP family OmpA-OmpF porin
MLRTIAFALAVLVAAPAAAQSWYAGGAIGEATAKDFCTDLTGPGISCEDSDRAWKVFAGREFTPHFALEIGYADLGAVRASGPGGFISAEASAFDIVAIGSLPLADRFAIYGKAGFYRGEVDARIDTVTLTDSASETNTDITFGAGLRFNVSPALAVRAEWQRYADIGGSETGESDVDVLSIGVLFRF